MVGSVLVGREAELGAIDAFLDDIPLGPTALVLTGEAGIGKTALWNAGVLAAERRVGRVLTCRGVEAESSLSFAGLSELLIPVLAETLRSLAVPRRRALEIALLLEEPDGMVPDAHAIGLAVLDVLLVLTERGPVVLGVDDFQWLDAESTGVLLVALRRIHDEPLGLLATVRTAPGDAAPVELERCFVESGLRRVSVSPLSLGALHRLLRERLGLDLSRPELVQMWEATAGNPFVALEIGGELIRLGVRPKPGQSLPVPGGLAQLLGARLARLSRETREVLLIAALAGRPTIGMLAAVHGDREGAIKAIDEAVRAGVVEFTDERVRFAHPLLASILHEQTPPGQRRSVHRALAEAAIDVEERARHLTWTVESPDLAVATELASAAEVAAARGATAAGAELYELAAGLTPDDPAAGRQHRLRAARLHRLAGDGARAVEMLEQLVVETPSGLQRSDVLFELASTWGANAGRHIGPGAPQMMLERMNEALIEAGADDSRAARILAFRAGGHMWVTDVRSALVDARAALASAERVGDPVLIAKAIARTGLAESYAVEITPGLLERGVEIEDRLGLILEYYESPRHELSRLLIQRGEIERPRAILEAMAESAATRGDEGTRLMVLWRLGLLEWLAGRWSQALDRVSTAHDLVEQTQLAHGLFWVGRVKALVEADLGLVAEARASAEQSLAVAQAASNEFFTITSLGSLGRVELALGNYASAASYLRELPRRLTSAGNCDPTTPVWADTIETLIALGELDLAHAYLDQYDMNAQRLQSPWAVASAARCRGLLAAAEGDVAGGVTATERAVAALEGVANPFERGRALMALGSVRRQAKQKGPARDALEQALTIFEELGARLWADKTRGELRRISGRRPAMLQLTESELQVAALAAEGRSNKQIAGELHMGVSTVEAHLSHVYRKLGVRRAELATRLPTMPDQTTDHADLPTHPRTLADSTRPRRPESPTSADA